MAEMSTPIGVTSGTLGAQRSDIVDFNRCGRPYVQLSMPHFSPPVALEEMAECNSTQTHAEISAALSGSRVRGEPTWHGKYPVSPVSGHGIFSVG